MSVFNGFSRQLWLHMLREGGRWRAAELRDEIPAYSYPSINTDLRRMTGTGAVVKYEDGRYGVTADCTVPRGVSLEDLRGLLV